MNAAGAAYEFAVRMTHAKHAVVRALSLWETWIVLASLAYLLGHFGAWARRDFRVSNGDDAFAFYAQEAAR